MKNVTSAALLEKLKSDTRATLLETKRLLQQDPELLLIQPVEGKWSVTQVVEHLNTYARYYLPIIEKKMNMHSLPPQEYFRSGWLGGFFTRSMLPKENGEVKNKMKAAKNHSPSNEYDSKVVLDEFVAHQENLLRLLDRAAGTSLNKVRIPISVSKYIRLNLGDTLGFLIAHHQRHFVQITNTLKVIRQNASAVSFG